MKKIVLIVLGVIIGFVLLVIAVMQIRGWIYINQDNPEPSNKNITFIGKSRGFYVYGKSFQQFDGSIITASTLNDIFTDRDYISLIKLSSKGIFEWEKKIQFASKNIWTMMQSPFKSEISAPHLEILGINLQNDKYYLLLNRTNNLDNQLYILTLNSKYQLINTQKIKLELENCTNLTAFMQNSFAHLCYLDETNKMLCQAKINITDGKIIHNAMLFYQQKGLYINAIAADKADTTASISAYDKRKGCSFYMYLKSSDLKEYFRTEPTSEFTVLKYIGDKLYGIVKEDSLLEIVDMTSLRKPLIVVNDRPAFQNFRAKDIQIMNGNIYVLLQVENSKQTDWDIVVRRFAAPGEKPKDYLIQGKRLEMACEIFPTADKHFLVLGQSFSLRKGKLLKIFATVFEQ